ncbi:hypothetical protein GE118_02110 [Mycoplasma sp. NEAQ87857]|uniref:aromatic motif membrane protein n=1 Tax=Mycoplasma sp. NEAQ87857 TaxID=2683967 RepID=UPI0013180B5C|nr:aromatic motif membrane protein [Mycoplasma sp. NEAQ87857]QGZ97589.1 hypothetical protein GE118_02110 [Mycoplasma sp. NEAQ87857]
MKTKLITFISLGTSLSAISCVNYSKVSQSFKFVDSDFDEVINNNQEIDKQNKLTKAILNKIYKSNSAAKLLFINQQKSPTINQIFKDWSVKYNEVATKLKTINIDNNEYQALEHQQTQLQDELNQLINQNWLFVLNNLSKFKLTFKFWFNNPLNNNAHLDKEYLINLLAKPRVKDISLNDAKISDFIEGEESKELRNTQVLYVLINNSVWRISINNLNNQPYVKFHPELWTFDKAKRPISLNLISNIIHSGFIHNDKEIINKWITDLVDKQLYGDAASMQLIYDEK